MKARGATRAPVVLPAFALLVAAAGDPLQDGLRHFAAGRFAAAAEAFRQAVAADPEDPRLHYNLALACWRSGDRQAAELAAEQAAVLASDFAGLRDGLVGNLRYDAALAVAGSAATAAADPQRQVVVLTRALRLAATARELFRRGALGPAFGDPSTGPALRRNYQRASVLEADLGLKLADARRRLAEQQKKSGTQHRRVRDPNQERKNRKDPEQLPPDDPRARDADKKEQRPDPDQQRKDPQDQEKDRDPNQPHPPPDQQVAPGEHDPGRALSPEQRRQLLARLQEFEEKQRRLRDDRRAARPRVEKDW